MMRSFFMVKDGSEHQSSHSIVGVSKWFPPLLDFQRELVFTVDCGVYSIWVCLLVCIA